jgi:hypothetical protein
MNRFQNLVEAIKTYDNEASGMKTTAHHSAVSVRVVEMEAAFGKFKPTHQDTLPKKS